MTCEEIDELAGAIALDAIPDEEWPAIRAHLATCVRGHADLRELRAVAALLLEAAPAVEPPAGLRERILATARAEISAGPPVPSALSTPPPDPRPIGSTGAARVVERGERSWWQRAAWPVAAAAVLVAAGMGTWNVSIRRDLSARDRRVAALERRIGADERALAVLAGGGRQYRFAATVAGAGGSVLRPETGAATIVVEGLPPRAGSAYQVWAIQGDRPVSIGIFEPDANGRKVVTLEGDLDNADSVAITLEPGPAGSRQPTTAPLLLAPIRG